MEIIPELLGLIALTLLVTAALCCSSNITNVAVAGSTAIAERLTKWFIKRQTQPSLVAGGDRKRTTITCQLSVCMFC
ncbi:hypothetical protein BDR07DRAFT_284289 [Suillus spraguei]|nr:hypothetical protein BDR07DRAFT_284289 [Suillus spraguei]